MEDVAVIMRPKPGTASLYFRVMEIFFHHKASPFVRKVLLGLIEPGADALAAFKVKLPIPRPKVQSPSV